MNWHELPFAPNSGQYLCSIDDIPNGGGFEVAFGTCQDRFLVLLLRRDEQVWAYLNNCPHFSLPLNYEPQKFIVMDKELVMCAHHTAFFNFDDGYCVDGPCKGSSLTLIKIRVCGSSIFID